MMTSSCFALSLILAFSTITNLNVPTLNMTVNQMGLVVNLSNLRCPSISIGKLELSYNNTGLLIATRAPLYVNCTVHIIMQGMKPFDLNAGVGINASDQVFISTIPDVTEPCYASSASLQTCTLAPQITSATVSPENEVIDTMMKYVIAQVNPMISNMICQSLRFVAGNLTNRTLNPLSPYPPSHPGATKMFNWPVGKAVVNVLNNLPNIGGMSFRSSIPSDSTLSLILSNLAIIDRKDIHFAFNMPALVPLSFDLTVAKFYVPKDTSMLAQVAIADLVCRGDGFHCVAMGGIDALNLRAHGTGNMDKIIDIIFTTFSKSALSKKMLCKNISMNIPTAADIQVPPVWLNAFICPLLILIGIGCVGFATFVHGGTSIQTESGIVVITTKRVFIESTVMTVLSFACFYLFIWSNSTTNASVLIGGEISMYSFSLGNSIHDLWNAGLIPLSVLVCIFSGIYPYVKLLSIVVFSVLLRHPLSRVLAFIDIFGIFSLLDVFVMVILKHGLEVNGIVEVNATPSFYMFATATIFSILLGSISVHFLNNGIVPAVDADKVASNDKPADNVIIHACEEYGTAIPISVVSDQTQEEEVPDTLLSRAMKEFKAALCLWEWYVAVPAGVAVLVFSCLALNYSIMRFNIKGIASIITGTEKSVTLWSLFNASNWYMQLIGLVTIVIAPILRSVGFPFLPFTNAWCAISVFLLACVAGLLQLEQFITFTMGAKMGPLYSATCTLLWPLIPMALSMVILWLITVKEMLGIKGVPSLQKLCKCFVKKEAAAEEDDNNKSSTFMKKLLALRNRFVFCHTS